AIKDVLSKRGGLSLAIVGGACAKCCGDRPNHQHREDFKHTSSFSLLHTTPPGICLDQLRSRWAICVPTLKWAAMFDLGDAARWPWCRRTPTRAVGSRPRQVDAHRFR